MLDLVGVREAGVIMEKKDLDVLFMRAARAYDLDRAAQLARESLLRVLVWRAARLCVVTFRRAR